VPLVYLVGLMAMLFTAASYVFMSRVYPVAGSVYTYAGRTMGESVGFLAGWAMLLDYLLLPTLVYVTSAVALQALVPTVPKAVWIVALLAFNTGMNIRGIETTARLGLLFMVLQLALLSVFLVVAILALGQGIAGAHLSTEPFFKADLISPAIIFSGLSFAVISFLGFDAISTLSEEAKDGAAAVGKATYLSLIVVALMFIVLTYFTSLFVLGRTSFAPGDATSGAVYAVMDEIGGPWFKALLTVPLVLFAGLPGALTAQVATSRLLFSMARDDKLPGWLARVNPKSNVPDRAVLLVAGVTLVLGIALADRLELLGSMVNFGALLGFLLLHMSVMVYVGRRRQDQGALRQIAVAALGFAIVAYVFVNLDATAVIAGLGWLAVGIAALLRLKLLRR